jgi:hypothetical protein
MFALAAEQSRKSEAVVRLAPGEFGIPA